MLQSLLDRTFLTRSVRVRLPDGHELTAGPGAPDSLHRIEVEQVKREVEAAGFVLDGSSDLLARADDPRSANVFDPSIRGHTSQFMLRFRKPA